MGNTCKSAPDVREIVQITDPASNYTDMHYKSHSLSIRMGQVQRLRSPNIYNNNNYIFIMPIISSEQIVKVECPVVTSYTDNLSLSVPILSNMNSIRLNARNPPILDYHDQNPYTPLNNNQVVHKFVYHTPTNQQQHYCVKVYPFSTYADTVFKNGIYEAYIYQTLLKFNKNLSIVKDIFVFEKNRIKTLVFVYNSYLCTLEDILLYRKNANMPYSKQQQNYIASQILQKYKVLYINNIVHRDIRPSKIYLSQSSNSKNPYLTSSGHLGYQFANLQTARKLTQKQKLMHPQGSTNSQMLMTVRGVPLYCDNTVQALHMRGDAAGNYDPWMNDRQQIAKTLSMIVTLQTSTTIVSNQDKIKKQNKNIYHTIKRLEIKKQDINHIIRDFIQHANSNSKSYGILQADYNIATNQLPPIIIKNNQNRIEQATAEMLFSLNHTQLYTNHFDKKLSNNYRLNKYEENIPIIRRLGQHYQNLGYIDNNYYEEEMNLLIMEARDLRERGYPTDKSLHDANLVYFSKFNNKLKNVGLQIQFMIENAYKSMREGNIKQAQTIMNNALALSSSNRSIPFDTQLKAITAKGIIQTQIRGPDAGDSYFMNGLDLSNNRNNFTTQVQMLEEQSNFQHLLAKNMIMRLNLSKGKMDHQYFLKQIAKCQAILTQAKNTKMNLPLKSTVPVASIYETFGDFYLLKEDYRQSANYYNKSYQLLQASDQRINNTQKIRVLLKNQQLYKNYSDNYAQQQKIKRMISDINRKQKQQIQDMNRNRTKTDQRHFQRIKFLKAQKNKALGETVQYGDNVIRQEDQGYSEDGSKMYARQNSMGS